VTGNYQAQWQVTFKAVDQSSATITDGSGTVVTVNSTGQSTNPYQAYFDQNASVAFSFENPLASSTAGKQYRLVSASTGSPLTVTAAVTVTGDYQAQWQLTFNLSGVSVDVAGGTQVFSITSPSAQAVTFSQFASNSYSEFFDAGSNLAYGFANPLASTSGGKQYALTPNLPDSITGLAAATMVTATYKAQYQVTFTQTNIPSADIAPATTVVSVNGAPEAFSSLPFNEYFDEGSAVPYTYAQAVADISLGKQWKDADMPVLVVSGTGSTVTTARQNRALAELINKWHPGRARYAEVEGMGHDFSLNGGAFAEEFLNVMFGWLEAVGK